MTTLLFLLTKFIALFTKLSMTFSFYFLAQIGMMNQQFENDFEFDNGDFEMLPPAEIQPQNDPFE